MRNLSLSNNSPQNPFNNPASSNESHTPLNRSLLESYYQEDLTSPDFNLEYEYDETLQNRPMLSVKSKPPLQFEYQRSGNPFDHLNLTGTGSGQSVPGRVPSQLNLPASGSGPTEPGLSSKDCSAEKFHAVLQDCILKSWTHATSTTAVHSENIPPSSTPEKSSKSIFGMAALPGFTFNSQEHEELLSSTPGGTLHSPPTPATDSIPPGILPELKVLMTGEEQEEVLFFRRARLYRYLNKEWKERGIGELKILLNPETGKHRILMRRDVVKKLCCNHYITQEMRIKKNQASEVTMNWYTPADFSDEVQQPEQFAARFKTVEIAAERSSINVYWELRRLNSWIMRLL